MPTFKKLIFAPFFLVIFGILIYSLSSIFKSYDFVFAISYSTLIQMIVISALISFTSFLFVLFASFALNWKLIVPVGILACILPMLLLEQAIGMVFVIGILISLLITYLSLEATMKTYLNFQPSVILGPSIRHFSRLLIIVIAVAYFLSINKVISEKGFTLPDALLDTALKFSQPQTSQTIDPQLLKQSGIDPKLLGNTLKAPIEAANNLIKQTIKDQLQNLLKPYLSFIPAILALFLFLSLQSFTSLINLLIYPLLWLIFLILEKTGFITFTEEMRPVKKLTT